MRPKLASPNCWTDWDRERRLSRTRSKSAWSRFSTNILPVMNENGSELFFGRNRGTLCRLKGRLGPILLLRGVFPFLEPAQVPALMALLYAESRALCHLLVAFCTISHVHDLSFVWVAHHLSQIPRVPLISLIKLLLWASSSKNPAR